MLDTFNATTSLLLFFLSGWAIVHPSVRDGIVIKIGLSCLSIGSLALFFSHVEPSGGERPMMMAQALRNLGLLICTAGYLWRLRSGPRAPGRRLSDFH